MKRCKILLDMINIKKYKLSKGFHLLSTNCYFFWSLLKNVIIEFLTIHRYLYRPRLQKINILKQSTGST